MATIYLILFILSLLAIKICMDTYVKQMGIHYVIFCILSAFTILFYYLMEIAETAEASLHAQIGIYVAMLFIPIIFSNMIHELSNKKSLVSQEIIMAAASLIAISVITTEYTGLFYKTYELIDGTVVKTYGIMHTFFYIYLATVFLFIFAHGTLQLFRNNVSKVSIALLILSAFILILSVFLGKIVKINFSFDALGLLFSEAFFIHLSRRLPLYDLEEAVIEANRKSLGTGIIAFDLKRRLLGYNDVVAIHVPEFKTLKTDYRIPESFPLKDHLERLMDQIDFKGSRHFEVLNIKNAYFSLSIEHLLVNNKVMGYQIICHDVTKDEMRIKEIENEVLKKSNESDKYYSILNKQLDPKLISKIISDDVLENQEKDIAVLFADISGFTSLSEEKSAREVISILNEILSFTEKCIVRNGGIVDKYIGDCVMAIWDDEDIHQSSLNACRAALEIKEEALKFSKENRFGIDVKFSQGIHLGNCVIGFIGDERHQEYTVIGDIVNTASRLQGAAETDQILVSKNIKDAALNKIKLKDIGKINLKGKKQATQVFELIKLNND